MVVPRKTKDEEIILALFRAGVSTEDSICCLELFKSAPSEARKFLKTLNLAPEEISDISRVLSVSKDRGEKDNDPSKTDSDRSKPVIDRNDIDLIQSINDREGTSAGSFASTPIQQPPLPSPLDSRSGGGCFIATAAYGTAYSRDVQVLKILRDEFLSRHSMGRTFIRYYYVLSPPLADFIRYRPRLKCMIRLLLSPIVLFGKWYSNSNRPH